MAVLLTEYFFQVLYLYGGYAWHSIIVPILHAKISYAGMFK